MRLYEVLDACLAENNITEYMFNVKMIIINL